MKKEAPNEYRLRHAIFPSTDDMGMRGMFQVPTPDGVELIVTVNVFPHEKDSIAMSKVGDRLSVPAKEHVDLVMKMFWEEDEIEDLITFQPTDLPMSQNVLHIRKRIHKWNLNTIKK